MTASYVTDHEWVSILYLIRIGFMPIQKACEIGFPYQYFQFIVDGKIYTFLTMVY
jgi:hypothetical protein